MARCAARAADPCTRTATTVPRSGRARSMLGGGEHECIGCQQPAHAVGEVAAGERRSGNIFDIAIELQRRAGVFPDELTPPRRQVHLATVAFVIVEDLELPYRAARIERHRIV